MTTKRRGDYSSNDHGMVGEWKQFDVRVAMVKMSRVYIYVYIRHGDSNVLPTPYVLLAGRPRRSQTVDHTQRESFRFWSLQDQREKRLYKSPTIAVVGSFNLTFASAVLLAESAAVVAALLAAVATLSGTCFNCTGTHNKESWQRKKYRKTKQEPSRKTREG